MYHEWESRGNPEVKRPLGRPVNTWVGNTKMDPREVRLDLVHWIYLAQNKYQWRVLVNTLVNFRVS
jgi:hypothetical protein